jgi:hypothetical protein
MTRDNLERGKALLPQATISQAAYDARRNEIDSAASALESAAVQLRQVANAVGYATLMLDFGVSLRRQSVQVATAA